MEDEQKDRIVAAAKAYADDLEGVWGLGSTSRAIIEACKPMEPRYVPLVDRDALECLIDRGDTAWEQDAHAHIAAGLRAAADRLAEEWDDGTLCLLREWAAEEEKLGE